jgi:hypothetical protein
MEALATGQLARLRLWNPCLVVIMACVSSELQVHVCYLRLLLDATGRDRPQGPVMNLCYRGAAFGTRLPGSRLLFGLPVVLDTNNEAIREGERVRAL